MCMNLKIQNNYFHSRFYSFYINLCNFQIISCILSTIGLIFLNGKAHYYPLKDIVGPSLCYFYVHTELCFGMYIQYASLFITFYRYICIFFGKKLVQLNISPKVKAETRIFFTAQVIHRGFNKYQRNSHYLIEKNPHVLNSVITWIDH